MAVDDRMRLRIHQKLEELMGPEEADALVSSVLPVPWREVVTKEDLRVLGAELRAELHQSIVSQTRWLIGSITALVAVALTAARLMF